MRRRLSSFAIVALFAACTFPQVSYESGGGDGGSGDGPSGADGTSGEGGSHGDGTVGDDATSEGSAGEGAATEGASGDGPAGGDTGSGDAPYVFEAAADAPVCDQDEDTYDVKGGSCGGLDCDDTDKHANPGVTTFQTYLPHPPSNGDWNCDGTVQTQFPTGFNCGLLSTGGCAGKKGFTDTPGCGQTSANFVTCKVSTALLCVVDTTSSNTQGCM